MMKKGLVLLLVVLFLDSQAFLYKIQMQPGLTLSIIKRPASCDLLDPHVFSTLQHKGICIKEGKETRALGMRQAASTRPEGLPADAEIDEVKRDGDQAEKWSVELIGGSEKWGWSILINPDKWLLYFAWGDFGLDFIWISDP